MKEVAVYEAKTRLSELLVGVQQGEQFTITRHGVAVARLVAAEPKPPTQAAATGQHRQVVEAFQVLAQLRQGVSLDLPLQEAIGLGRD